MTLTTMIPRNEKTMGHRSYVDFRIGPELSSAPLLFPVSLGVGNIRHFGILRAIQHKPIASGWKGRSDMERYACAVLLSQSAIAKTDSDSFWLFPPAYRGVFYANWFTHSDGTASDGWRAVLRNASRQGYIRSYSSPFVPLGTVGGVLFCANLSNVSQFVYGLTGNCCNRGGSQIRRTTPYEISELSGLFKAGKISLRSEGLVM